MCLRVRRPNAGSNSSHKIEETTETHTLVDADTGEKIAVLGCRFSISVRPEIIEVFRSAID